MNNRPFSTNYKPKTKIEAPSELPAANELISTARLVSYITKQCANNYDSRRDFRNKVSGCIRYAIRNGFIQDHGHKVMVGEAIMYLRTKRRYANGLATLTLPITGSIHVELQALRGSASGTSLPTSIDECHRVLIESAHRVADLERRLAAAEQQLAEQKPYVETGRKMRRPKAR
jgi:hypothetical protein